MPPAPPDRDVGAAEPSGIGRFSGSAGVVVVCARAGSAESARAVRAAARVSGHPAAGIRGGEGRVRRRGVEGDPCLVGEEMTMAVTRRRTGADVQVGRCEDGPAGLLRVSESGVRT